MTLRNILLSKSLPLILILKTFEMRKLKIRATNETEKFMVILVRFGVGTPLYVTV